MTEVGQVFVCGGPQLAVPGTTVVIENATTLETVSVDSTDLQGTSGSTACDVLFPGRCDTTQPGTFCAVLDGSLGERMLVTVEDVLGNFVTLDAGNMRDEFTGAEVIGPEGGVVTFPGDEHYSAIVPEGAFEEPMIVRVTPVEDAATSTTPGIIDLFDPTRPDLAALTNPDLAPHLELVGAVEVTFEPVGRVAQVQYDVTVPYVDPPLNAEDSQYAATQVIDFRGGFALTMIDTAFFDVSTGRVVTDPSVFPGLRIGGTFGLMRWKECIGIVNGFVNIGDFFNDGYISSDAPFGPLLPVPIDSSEPLEFQVPLPCNTPVPVFLRGLGDESIDQCCEESGCIVEQDEVLEDACVLTDDTQSPSIEGVLIADGAKNVDPVPPLDVVFSEPMDPASGSENITVLYCGEIEEADAGCTGGVAVPGEVELSEDGRTATFLPRFHLRYGARYVLSIDGNILDLNKNPLGNPQSRSFETFRPRIVGRVEGVDARDVVVINGEEEIGSEAPEAVLIVAEGDGISTRIDSQGGVVFYDVSDLVAGPILVERVFTAGVDRALVYAPGPPVETANAQTFSGPFVMSIDGPGGPDRFGVWRLIDLSAFPTPTLVASRFLNQSANTFNRLSSVDDPFAPPLPYDLGTLLSFVPNDVGVPLDLASFGTEVAYIANAPHIGLEAIVPDGMNTDLLAEKQVTGILRGDFDPQTNRDRSFPIRAVDTLPDVDPDRSLVIAVAQQGSDDKLLSIYPQLSLPDGTPLVPDEFLLPDAGHPLAVKALKIWPTRRKRDERDLTPTDLAVVMCEGGGMCVVPIDATSAKFSPGLLVEGLGDIETPGSPRGAAADPATRELVVADGTAGLTIIDLEAPGGGKIDEVPPEGDDRVVFTVPLEGARAQQVALYRDAAGRRMAAVAAGTDGVFLVQVGPALIEFEGAWEADNEANFITNDKPYCEESDARVEPEALFLVEEESAKAPCSHPDSYCFILKLAIAPEVPHESVLWKIEADGVKVAPPGPNAGTFPEDSNENVVEVPAAPAGLCFPNGPTDSKLPDSVGDLDDCKRYEIRFGIDLNQDQKLDEVEWKPYFAHRAAGVAVRPYVVGLDDARYDEAYQEVDGLIRGEPVPFLNAFAEARALLHIFRDDNPDAPEASFQPTGRETVSFDLLSDEFSDWLTHNSGADFERLDGRWKTNTMRHLTWGAATRQSQLIAQSDILLNEVKEILKQNTSLINVLRANIPTWEQ